MSQFSSFHYLLIILFSDETYVPNKIEKYLLSTLEKFREAMPLGFPTLGISTLAPVFDFNNNETTGLAPLFGLEKGL